MPSIGLDTVFARSYDNFSTENGVLGYGWRHSYNIYLQFIDSTKIAFVNGSGAHIVFTEQSINIYKGPTGCNDTLIKNVDNTYTLTKMEGLNFNFDTTGKIVSIVDNNSNTMNFIYSGSRLVKIIDTTGRSDRELNFTSIVLD